jgi:polyisoprenoid-binding protein YceI
MRLPRVLVLAALLAAPALVAGFTSVGEAGAVFKAVGTGGFKMEGKTKQVAVTDDNTSVTVTVTLTDIATGISLRDNHAKKYLEVEKFPTTTLQVKKAALKIPEGAGPLEGSATGAYTLHGVTKDLPFTYKGSCAKDGTCAVEGSMNINMKDFGVQVPSYLGITVKPDVVVTSSFTVKR